MAPLLTSFAYSALQCPISLLSTKINQRLRRKLFFGGQLVTEQVKTLQVTFKKSKGILPDER